MLAFRTSAIRGPPIQVLSVDCMVQLRSLYPVVTFPRILGVSYVHVKTDGDDDLYVTSHGWPFLQQLLPINWYEPHWFIEHRRPLRGTGNAYRLSTKPIKSSLIRSIELVVKYSRVGQEVPLDTFTLGRNINAEFNSPFEEFSIVEELRRSQSGRTESRVFTQRPLAIYAPSEQMYLWQTGRSRERMLAKVARHVGVTMDALRTYVLVYGWIDGLDATEAFSRCHFEPSKCREELELLTKQVDDELRRRGFVVSDHKPAHFIVRLRNETIRRRRDGSIPLALVDYELLLRTRESRAEG